jgi:hypothetical protein
MNHTHTVYFEHPKHLDENGMPKTRRIMVFDGDDDKLAVLSAANYLARKGTNVGIYRGGFVHVAATDETYVFKIKAYTMGYNSVEDIEYESFTVL